MAWSGVTLCDWLFLKILSTLVEQVANTCEIVGIPLWGVWLGDPSLLRSLSYAWVCESFRYWRSYLKRKSQWLVLRKPKSLCMLFRLDQQGGSLFGGRRRLFKKTTDVSSENTDLFIWKIGSTFTHLPCSEFKVWYPWPSTVAGKPP